MSTISPLDVSELIEALKSAVVDPVVEPPLGTKIDENVAIDSLSYCKTQELPVYTVKVIALAMSATTLNVVPEALVPTIVPDN